MSGWGFGNIWGGGGGSAAKNKNATKDAILTMRGTLDMLGKREKHLQNQMDDQDAIARKNVTTNKTRECIVVPRWALLTRYSCENSITAEEDIRASARTNECTDDDSGARDIVYRDREH